MFTCLIKSHYTALIFDVMWLTEHFMSFANVCNMKTYLEWIQMLWKYDSTYAMIQN